MALVVEDNVGSTPLGGELRPHPLGRQHGAATQARRLGARHGAPTHFFVRFRFEHFELDTRGDPAGRSTRCRSAHFRFAFLHSQNERMSGISAPQFGASQRTVRAQR